MKPNRLSPPISNDGLSSTEQHRENNLAAGDESRNVTENAPEKREDVPPDGGYGWVCTGCNFFINAHTWGINSVSNSLQRYKSLSLIYIAVIWCFPVALPD